MLGCQDTVRFGGENSTGWLVDTFGHISQSPQIHRLGGIESVYVWRGVPILEPYFHWQGTNGEELFAINLFGGYRNLYGVTHVPEIGVQRLLDEAAKLEPFYPSPDIPLFDGYDLEDNPEDPFRFYKEHLEEITPRITLVKSSPQDFARQISQKMKDLPTYQGELNSGKYAATFPGTLSTRIYLKVMSEDCERLLYQVCEPLGVLARLQGRAYEQKQYESWSRALLQNAVHDCICGVSIDQVHEKMEFTSRQIFDAIQDDIQASLAHILQDFAPGTYAISTNPIPYDGWQVIRNQLYSVQTDGIGVWRVEDSIPVYDSHELIESFTWHNDYYSAQLMEDGTLQVENSIMGALAIYREKGDAYSDERGELIEISRPQKPYLIEQKSDHHCVVKLTYSANWDDARLNAIIRLTFDRSPLIRWRVDLDTRGTDFSVDILFDHVGTGKIFAGMPFDILRRPSTNPDLLPRQLDSTLSGVLIGQPRTRINQHISFPGVCILIRWDDFHNHYGEGSALLPGYRQRKVCDHPATRHRVAHTTRLRKPDWGRWPILLRTRCPL